LEEGIDMISEQVEERKLMKECFEKIDRKKRAFYKAVRNMTRDFMDMNYSKEEIEDMRKDLHEKLDRYMNAELNDEELIFPVDKEWNENHNDF
jgi:hypothetical protein